MGLPSINFVFTKKAKEFITRSSRGMCLLILNDETKEQKITVYTRFTGVLKEDWSEKNNKYIQLAFMGNPGSVVCVRAAKTESVIDFAGTMELFRYINFDYAAYPEMITDNQERFKEFLDERRLQKKKGKAVMADFDADDPAIINFTQNNISVLLDDDGAVEKFTSAEYCARIAGICSGIPLTQSTTYYELDEIVDIELIQNEDAAIDAGKLIIIFDGEKYKIGRGVTSLIKASETVPADFKKIKLLEAADLILTDIVTTWNDNYVGRKNNSYDNKMAFIGAVNEYLKELENTVVDAQELHEIGIDLDKTISYLQKQGIDVSTMREQQIKEKNTGANLFLSGSLKLLDAMEDLDISMAL